MIKIEEFEEKSNEISEADLIKAIEEFYLPRHLVKAIYEIGHIPSHSQESQVGVGFIDIADYTRLSKFLSPKENQTLLNGLYTAFQIVLERHGGFLNKIEGDSMMFHFDDVIDKRLWDLETKERITFIARELFYTCVEMQRVCVLFNQAEAEFLEGTENPEFRKALSSAFDIIKALRSKDDIASTLFAFFQIKIRIGANIGEVTIGNFGPDGSKHWDIIGLPVINAKRMESTAPVGGLRISSEFFDILNATGIAEEYYTQFRSEAKKQDSVYKNIRWDDLFRFREVVLQEKRGAEYKTYSVQVYPSLPESVSRQAKELIQHGIPGAHQIIEFFKYYRGNRYVIDLLEKTLTDLGVIFRKGEMLSRISAKIARTYEQTEKPLSLYKVLSYLDQYLDYVQAMPEGAQSPMFVSYEQYTKTVHENAMRFYEKTKKVLIQQTFYLEVIVPQIYAAIEASLREYQFTLEQNSISDFDDDDDVEELELLEEI